MNFDLKNNKKQLIMVVIIAILAIGSLYMNVIKGGSDPTNVAPTALPNQATKVPGGSTNPTTPTTPTDPNNPTTPEDNTTKGPGGVIIKNSTTQFPGAGRIKNVKNNPFKTPTTPAPTQ